VTEPPLTREPGQPGVCTRPARVGSLICSRREDRIREFAIMQESRFRRGGLRSPCPGMNNAPSVKAAGSSTIAALLVELSWPHNDRRKRAGRGRR